MRGTQTKLGSVTEAILNVIVGMAINFFFQVIVMQALGYAYEPKKFLIITLIFTAVSVIRSYCLRRLFNYIKFGNEAVA